MSKWYRSIPRLLSSYMINDDTLKINQICDETKLSTSDYFYFYSTAWSFCFSLLPQIASIRCGTLPRMYIGCNPTTWPRTRRWLVEQFPSISSSHTCMMTTPGCLFCSQGSRVPDVTKYVRLYSSERRWVFLLSDGARMCHRCSPLRFISHSTAINWVKGNPGTPT